MATQAKLARRFDQIRIVTRSMHIVAVEAGHTAPIHDALNEVVPLHPVLVSRTVSEMHEVCLA